jgi:hypothetical protein
MHRGIGSGGWAVFGTVTTEYRESGRLPDKPGVIIVDIEGAWSLDVVDTEPVAWLAGVSRSTRPAFGFRERCPTPGR